MSSKVILRRIYNKIKYRRVRLFFISLLKLFRQPYLNIALDTNNVCNLRCIMCHHSLEVGKKPEFMSMDIFKALAKDAFAKARVLDLSCSYEPFMTKDFISYLKIAREHCKKHMTICTNALLLNEEKITQIVEKQLLDEIIISIDGFSKETYESIRQGGNFETLVRNLELLHKIRGTRTKPEIRMNFTMMRRNVEDLRQAVPFLLRYGVSTLQLRHVKLSSRFTHLEQDSLFFHQELSDSILRQLLDQASQHPGLEIIAPPLFSDSVTSHSTKEHCAYAWFKYILRSNGEVKMCNVGVIGDLNRDSFTRIINSPEARRIRREIRRGGSEHCRQCLGISDLGDVSRKETFISPPEDAD